LQCNHHGAANAAEDVVSSASIRRTARSTICNAASSMAIHRGRRKTQFILLADSLRIRVRRQGYASKALGAQDHALRVAENCAEQGRLGKDVFAFGDASSGNQSSSAAGQLCNPCRWLTPIPHHTTHCTLELSATSLSRKLFNGNYTSFNILH
jgi:hypothetical protein